MANQVVAPNVTAPRLPGGKFSSTGVTKKSKPKTKYVALTPQQHQQLEQQLNAMIDKLATWPGTDPKGYAAAKQQAIAIYRQLTYSKMHSIRKTTTKHPRAHATKAPKRMDAVMLTGLPAVDLARYANQTVIYGPGHKIIGNIGNGAGIKAEAQLHYGKYEKSTPKAVESRANRAAAKLGPDEHAAMSQRRGELIELAAKSHDPEEQKAARDGAIILQRQLGRYDKAQTAEKAPAKPAATKAPTKPAASKTTKTAPAAKPATTTTKATASAKSTKYNAIADLQAGKFVEVKTANNQGVAEHVFAHMQKAADGSIRVQTYDIGSLLPGKTASVTQNGEVSKIQSLADLKVAAKQWQSPQSFDSLDAAKQYVAAEVAKATSTMQRGEPNAAHVAAVRQMQAGTLTKFNGVAVGKKSKDTAAFIKGYAKAHNMTVPEYLHAVDHHLQHLVDKAPVQMRRTFGGTERLLKDGTFRTQFETGTASGTLDLAGRRELENRVFGVPEFAPDSERLRYGFLAVGPDPKEVDMYGSVNYEFKSSVRSRTTMTIGDSLATADRATHAAGNLNHINSTVWNFSGHNGDPLKLASLDDLAGRYVEAQVHGSVTLADVGKISFTKEPPTPQIIAELQAKGFAATDASNSTWVSR